MLADRLLDKVSSELGLFHFVRPSFSFLDETVMGITLKFVILFFLLINIKLYKLKSLTKEHGMFVFEKRKEEL